MPILTYPNSRRRINRASTRSNLDRIPRVQVSNLSGESSLCAVPHEGACKHADAKCPGYRSQTKDGSSLLKAWFLSSLRFHLNRIRDLDWRQRASYLSAQSTQRLEDIVDSLSTWQHTAFRWVQRNLAFPLPRPVQNSLTVLVLCPINNLQ